MEWRFNDCLPFEHHTVSRDRYERHQDAGCEKKTWFWVGFFWEEPQWWLQFVYTMYICPVTIRWFASKTYCIYIFWQQTYQRSFSWQLKNDPEAPIINPSEPTTCWFRKFVLYVECNQQTKYDSLAIICDLFGMVKWPLQMVKWPPNRGWKGHFESPGQCFLTNTTLFFIHLF